MRLRSARRAARTASSSASLVCSAGVSAAASATACAALRCGDSVFFVVMACSSSMPNTSASVPILSASPTLIASSPRYVRACIARRACGESCGRPSCTAAMNCSQMLSSSAWMSARTASGSGS